MRKDLPGEPDAERMQIFQFLFQSTDRFYGKNILLYGLNDDTKKAIMFLAKLHIPIVGFLAAQDEAMRAGMEYLGKPVFGKESFLNMETADYVVLDVYGDFLQEIWDVCKVRGDTLFKVLPGISSEPFLIYGTSDSGRELGILLSRCGIEISCFCDRCTERREWMSEDCVLISPEELDHISKTLPAIIAIHDMKDVKEVKALLKGKGFSNIYHFDLAFFDLRMWEKRTGNSYIPVWGPVGMRYLHRILSKQREIFFFTNDITYGLNVLSTMKILGIPVGSIVTTKKGVDAADPQVASAYDLLFKDPSSFVIWALPGDEDNAREFMQKSGIPEDIFLHGPWGPWLLKRKVILDTHLGYADSRGTVIVRNCAKEENALKVVILGGSTSDYDEFFERSWPSWLLELAQESGIQMECLMAAKTGYASSQELICLIRDIIWTNPDIVISYSGINEYTQTVKNYRFANKHQKAIFEKLANNKANPLLYDLRNSSSFSMGEQQDDAPTRWFINERIMNAACQEFGISFFSILQACLNAKRPISRVDLEMLEHETQPQRKLAELTELTEFVTREMSKYPWFYDFTNIFDGMQDEIFFDCAHVYGNKNRLIAEKILLIIREVTGENI